MSFCIRTGSPTTTGRAAPGLGPALGPETGPVASGWPGMFSRLNLGTTATLTLRLGRAWTEGKPLKSVTERLIGVELVCDEMDGRECASTKLCQKVFQVHNS